MTLDKKPRRRASSFPPQFMQVLMHVATTGTPLRIDSLENTRSAYTSMRARINEFRAAFKYEAELENDPARKTLCNQIYSVVVTDPEYDPDEQVWFCMVKPRDNEMASALSKALGKTLLSAKTPILPEVAPAKEPTGGAASIAAIYGTGESDEETS